MKLLIVEDNLRLIEDAFHFLTEEGFICHTALSYASASEKIFMNEYDVVIVDICLPDGNGLDLIKEIKKQKKETGILIISAKNSVDDKITGLDLGADDYITKPFHFAELNARIRSLLRRKKFDGNNVIVFNEISIDTYKKVVKVHDKTLILTKKEYELLLFFIYNKGRALTKENIAEHLWEDNIDLADNFDFIYNHIKNLRKKLLAANSSDYIKSLYGIGYKFEE